MLLALSNVRINNCRQSSCSKRRWGTCHYSKVFKVPAGSQKSYFHQREKVIQVLRAGLSFFYQKTTYKRGGSSKVLKLFKAAQP